MKNLRYTLPGAPASRLLDKINILPYFVPMLPTVMQESAPVSLKPVTKDSLTQRVAVILKRYILTENLQEGDRLPSERTLAATLGVSHRVVREAEVTLVAQGIIVKEHGRGSFVRPFDREQVAAEISLPPQQLPRPNDLLSARIALEIGIMPIVAVRATEADLDRLQALVDQMKQRQSRNASTASEDLQFHLTLLESTRNEWLQRLDYLIRESMQLLVYNRPGLISRSVQDMSHVIHAHQAIVHALRGRDAMQAIRAMHDHLKLSLHEALMSP